MSHPILKPSFDPNWKPLLDHLGEDLCSQFMFMATYTSRAGRLIHTFKHRSTKRYLNIDETGTFYRYADQSYVPTTSEEALHHVYG